MIINYLLDLIFNALGSIFQFLPVVTLATIPTIGPVLSSSLITIIKTYNAFIVTLPYAQIGVNVLLYVILPFELLLLVGKFFLGHRLPVNHKD